MGEALARLSDPDSQEQHSPFGDHSAFVVDLARDDGVAIDDPRLGAAGSRLAGLACPSVGLAASQGMAGQTASARLASCLDLVVASDEELEMVLSRIAAKPLATMTLVQLLRHNAGCGLIDGLLAESLAYSTLQSGPEFAAWAGANPGPVDSAGQGEEEQPLLLSREGNCLRLELNRSERRNAFSRAMRDALAGALDLALRDPTVDRVLVSGRGSDFCSGGDLGEFGTLDDPATAHAVRSTRNVGRLVDSMRDRIEFRVHGAAVGAGIELAAFAGRVVAAPDSFFELPELGMGLVPGAGGTVSILRRIGRQRLTYMAITGVRVPGALALTWGLVDEIAG